MRKEMLKPQGLLGILAEVCVVIEIMAGGEAITLQFYPYRVQNREVASIDFGGKGCHVKALTLRLLSPQGLQVQWSNDRRIPNLSKSLCLGSSDILGLD
jgi:hypothetical protein